jgi:hypothetical protein
MPVMACLICCWFIRGDGLVVDAEDTVSPVYQFYRRIFSLFLRFAGIPSRAFPEPPKGGFFSIGQRKTV